MLRRLLNALARRLPEKRIAFDGDVYLRRFYLFGRMPEALASTFRYGPAIRERLGWLPTCFLHCLCRPDRDRDLHNHPWDGNALILVGGYVEERWIGPPQTPGAFKRVRVFSRGQVNRLTAQTYHRIAQLIAPEVQPEVWTLFVTGVKIQSWGFWDESLGRHVGHREYVPKDAD